VDEPGFMLLKKKNIGNYILSGGFFKSTAEYFRESVEASDLLSQPLCNNFPHEIV